MKKVNLARATDARQMTLQALQGIDGSFFRGKSVLVKPDAAYVLEAKSSRVTNPLVVGALLDWLRENGATELAIGESPALGVRAADAFAASCLADLAAEKNARLLDFDGGAHVALPVQDGQRSFLVATAALNDYDCLVSLPVWRPAPFPLSLMNLRGLMWRAQKLAFYGRYAPGISPEQAGVEQAFSDLSRCVRADLTVIDGSFSMRCKDEGLVLATVDSGAADQVAACFVCQVRLAAKLFANRLQHLAGPVIFPVRFMSRRAGPKLLLPTCRAVVPVCLQCIIFLIGIIPGLIHKKRLIFLLDLEKGRGLKGVFTLAAAVGSSIVQATGYGWQAVRRSHARLPRLWGLKVWKVRLRLADQICGQDCFFVLFLEIRFFFFVVFGGGWRQNRGIKPEKFARG